MKRGFLLGLGILIVVIGILANMSLFTVHERTQALVIQFGEPRELITDPGLHFKLPWQSVFYFDKRVLDYDARTVEVPTLDQKQLIINAYIRYRIEDPLRYYQTVRTEADATSRVAAFMEASLRQIVGNVPMLNILTDERAELMRRITEQVDRDAERLGIAVLDVRMKRVDLPEDNMRPILTRMQTQREQEARRIRAEGEKDARRIRAEADKQERIIVAEAKKQAEILRGEGDAQATRTYNAAFGQDPEFFDFWRSMQALARGLSEQTTSFVGAPDGDFFRYFGNVGGGTVAGADRARSEFGEPAPMMPSPGGSEQ